MKQHQFLQPSFSWLYWKLRVSELLELIQHGLIHPNSLIHPEEYTTSGDMLEMKDEFLQFEHGQINILA
jgi:hypothetical protein